MKVVAIVGLCLIYSISRADAVADACSAENCKIENDCRCSTSESPLDKTLDETPQLIALTFDESVVEDAFFSYWEPLLYERLNPDERPISATFFVPHDSTDYEMVNDLYVSGFEIGVHSVTKNNLQEYWRNADLETLVKEFNGVKQIISKFANIPLDHIQGVRTPQLQLAGDRSIEAYIQSNLTYDSSWPTLPNLPIFPYSLDYLTTQTCSVSVECPTESHPGVWVAPIIDINGLDANCNSLPTCNVTGSAQQIANWLLQEVEVRRTTDKAPLTLLINSYWFKFTENSFEGFKLFLDGLAKLKDVFLVSQKQIIDWTKNPVPLSEFETDYERRTARCTPINCRLTKVETGDTAYMKSCIACPAVYPWLGNPNGNA